MAYDPRVSTLYILANTHHSGRRLAIDADLPAGSYEIIPPSSGTRLEEVEDGYYAACSGSGLHSEKVAVLVETARTQGLVFVPYQEVLRAGHVQRIREEGNLRCTY